MGDGPILTYEQTLSLSNGAGVGVWGEAGVLGGALPNLPNFPLHFYEKLGP